MTTLSITKPVVGQKNTVAEPAVGTALSVIEAWANGNIDNTNLKAKTAAANLGEHEVTETMLSAEVQTKLNSTVEIGTAYGVRAERTNNTEYEPSPSSATFVSGFVTSQSNKEMQIEVFVGGNLIASANVAAAGVATTVPVGFIVPAGKKYKIKVEHLQGMETCYLSI